MSTPGGGAGGFAALGQVFLVFRKRGIQHGDHCLCVLAGSAFPELDLNEGTRNASGGAEDGRVRGLIQQGVGVLRYGDLGL
ncbi:hypothetical protein ACW0JT_24745 [Arthrobacter sp. SA17]